MSESRDEWLASALGSGGDDPPPRADCPDADRIWRAVHLELPLDERLAVIDHVAECPACAEAWRAAREMTPPAVRAPVPRQSRMRVFAAAAVLALVAMPLAWYILRQPPPVERGRDVLQSGVPSGEALPRKDFRLRWLGGPDGARYDVTVSTTALTEIVTERGLTRPEYRVAPERLTPFPSGTEVLWIVVARAPDGRTVSSPTFKVVLR